MVDTATYGNGNGILHASPLSQPGSPPPTRLLGIPAVQQLRLPPAKTPAGLTGFDQEEMPHIRICSKKNHRGNLQERVLILAKYCFLMTDLKGKVKRFLKFADIVSLKLQPIDTYYEMHLVASSASAEHDLLLHLIHDHRNHCTSDRKGIEEFAQLYETVASAFLGKQVAVEWRSGGCSFSSEAQLNKTKYWKAPHIRCSEAKKRSQSPRRSSVPYDANMSPEGSYTTLPPQQQQQPLFNSTSPGTNTFQPASPMLISSTVPASTESSPRAATNPDPQAAADMSPNESVASFSSPKMDSYSSPEVSKKKETDSSSKKKADDEIDLDDGWGPIGGFSSNAQLPILDLLSEVQVPEANAPGSPSFKTWTSGNASSPTIGSLASFNSSSPTFLQSSKRPNFSEGL